MLTRRAYLRCLRAASQRQQPAGAPDGGVIDLTGADDVIDLVDSPITSPVKPRAPPAAARPTPPQPPSSRPARPSSAPQASRSRLLPPSTLLTCTQMLDRMAIEREKVA